MALEYSFGRLCNGEQSQQLLPLWMDWRWNGSSHCDTSAFGWRTSHTGMACHQASVKRNLPLDVQGIDQNRLGDGTIPRPMRKSVSKIYNGNKSNPSSPPLMQKISSSLLYSVASPQCSLPISVLGNAYHSLFQRILWIYTNDRQRAHLHIDVNRQYVC